MKNTKEVSLMNRVKGVFWERLSDALIHQADEGIKFSPHPFVSETVIPVELMKQDTH